MKVLTSYDCTLQIMFEGGMSQRKDRFRQVRVRVDLYVSAALEARERGEDAIEYLWQRAEQKLTFQHNFRATIENDYMHVKHVSPGQSS